MVYLAKLCSQMSGNEYYSTWLVSYYNEIGKLSLQFLLTKKVWTEDSKINTSTAWSTLSNINIDPHL